MALTIRGANEATVRYQHYRSPRPYHHRPLALFVPGRVVRVAAYTHPDGNKPNPSTNKQALQCYARELINKRYNAIRSLLCTTFRAHIVIPSPRCASGRHALDKEKLAISTFLGAKVSKDGKEREIYYCRRLTCCRLVPLFTTTVGSVERKKIQKRYPVTRSAANKRPVSLSLSLLDAFCFRNGAY